MWLIAVYVLFMIVGDGIDLALGFMIEKVWPAAGMPVFLALYFITLWLAWIWAVRLTESADAGFSPALRPADPH